MHYKNNNKKNILIETTKRILNRLIFPNIFPKKFSCGLVGGGGWLLLLFALSLFIPSCTCADITTSSSTTPDSTFFTNHAFSIPEGNTLYRLVGTLNAIDNDVIESFAITAGNSNASTNAVFALSNTLSNHIALYTVAPLDYETTSNYTLSVSVTDPAGNRATNNVQITLTDVNIPISIVPQSFILRERSPSNTVVGTIHFSADTDATLTLAFGNTITNVLSNVGNRLTNIITNMFSLANDGVLRTLQEIDYEKRTTYQLKVEVRDLNNNVSNVLIPVQVSNVLDEVSLRGINNRQINHTGIVVYEQGFLIFNYENERGTRFDQQMVFESNVFTNLANYLGFFNNSASYCVYYWNGVFYLPEIYSGSKIFRVNKDGTELAPLTHNVSGNTYGVVHYQNSFYLTESGADKVYVIPLTGGSSTTNFNLHADNNGAYGIEYFNGSFYVVDLTDAKVYRYSTNFTLQESFTLDPEQTRPFDITYSPEHNSFWISHDDTDPNEESYGSKLFRYTTNFTREF